MMKKYLTIVNSQTLFIIALSLLSCYLSLRFNFIIYADFLIIGIVIVFPLTFTMREAFKRRERSLQYLSLFKASLQSVFYSLQDSKLKDYKKAELKYIAANVSDSLLQYLAGKTEDDAAVQNAHHSIVVFIEENKKDVKKISNKILLFLFRLNESIEFLLAVRRHHTPWGPKAIVLFAIYLFAIFYPPSVLNRTGFDIALWNLFLMTGFKVLILFSLYNVQVLMEDPFNQASPDGIRLDDFKFTPHNTPVAVGGNGTLIETSTYNQL